MKVSANPLYVVIPAKAGFSTAELVIHIDLFFPLRSKMDSRFRGNDDLKKGFVRKPLMQLFHRH